MHDLNSILARIHSGAKVRIVQDSYGQERVEIRRSWFPIPARVELSRDEMTKVKAALGARSRKNRHAVPVTF